MPDGFKTLISMFWIVSLGQLVSAGLPLDRQIRHRVKEVRLLHREYFASALSPKCYYHCILSFFRYWRLLSKYLWCNFILNLVSNEAIMVSFWWAKKLPHCHWRSRYVHIVWVIIFILYRLLPVLQTMDFIPCHTLAQGPTIPALIKSHMKW